MRICITTMAGFITLATPLIFRSFRAPLSGQPASTLWVLLAATIGNCMPLSRNVAALAVMLLAAPLAADPLQAVQQQAAAGHADAARSQQTVDHAFEQSQQALAEYRAVREESENLKIYNQHLADLLADQQASLAAIGRQLASIEGTRQGVVPLMYRMLDSLEQFVALDVPLYLPERQQRLAGLRQLMATADVATAEKYRQLLEAYLLETGYGNRLGAYQGELDVAGQQMTVDYLHLGRVVLLALTLDQRRGWLWSQRQRQWLPLADNFLRPATQALRMARKQAAVDLLELPLPAAEVLP